MDWGTVSAPNGQGEGLGLGLVERKASIAIVLGYRTP
jgi:hypothetical protein